MLSQNLPQRLEICVEKAGGKRALAKKTGISESQIFRYLKGEGEPSLAKLEKIAEGAGVRRAWLLAADGEPDFEPTMNYSISPNSRRLLSHLLKLFDEALMEYQGNYTIEQKSLAIPLLMRAAQHEIDEGRPQPFTNNRSMHKAMYFLESLKKEEDLKFLHSVFDYIEAGEIDTFNASVPKKFVSLVCKSSIDVWDSKTGEVCFERIGGSINPQKKKHIHNVISQVLGGFKGQEEIKTLDLGCGNGRYILYFQEAYPRLAIQGIDASIKSIEMCNRLEMLEKVPAGTFQLGDARNTPYKNTTFDFVYSFNVFQCIPFLSGTGCGAGAVFEEIARILKPGGYFYLSTLHGKGCEYLPYLQYLNEDDVAKLAQGKFEITFMERIQLPMPKKSSTEDEQKYFDQAHILLKKI